MVYQVKWEEPPPEAFSLATESRAKEIVLQEIKNNPGQWAKWPERISYPYMHHPDERKLKAFGFVGEMMLEHPGTHWQMLVDEDTNYWTFWVKYEV